MSDSTGVILLAGGSGSRMGKEQAKQFIRIAGKPVLVHSFDALRAHLPNAHIVVVAPLDAMASVREMLQADPNCTVVAGGSSRQASTLQGLLALQAHAPHNVWIHDAARPFVDGQIIHEVQQALEKDEAVDVAIPTADTIIVERDGYIQNIPKRAHILRGQTPQAFRYGALLRSYQDIGPERLDQFTDDCGIYLETHPFGRVRIVRGHEENLKITNPIDLVLADELFRIRATQAAPNQNGIELRGKRALIFGGTAGIGKAFAQVMLDAGGHVHTESRSTGCDISRYADVERAVAQAVQTMGGIDLVVNSAGVLDIGALATQSLDTVARHIEINLTGAMWVAKASYDALKLSQGMLIQFASSSYTRGRADYVVYSATKAAIVNMTQGLSEEWANDGVRVNCVVPGRTDTAMRRVNFANECQASLSNPYEVALACAKAASSNISGQILRV